MRRCGIFSTATMRRAQTILSLAFVLAVLVPAAMGQAATQGTWTTMSYTMPINPIHVALMNNGKILVIAGSGNCPASQSGCPSGPPYGPSNGSGALVLDPVAQSITQYSVAWDMFCNGMTMLADGRVFIAGGTVQYDNPFLGQKKTSIFDPATNTFTDHANMAHGRWYPTVTLLSDGRVMVWGGFNDTNGANTASVEIYTLGTGWSTQYNTSPFTPPLYPRMHLLPSGNVFYSGSSPTSYIFNPTNQMFTQSATTQSGVNRTYGSSVLLPLTPANSYDPQIMILGGNIPTRS